MRALFGGTIAVVLLGIYVHLISLGYDIVDCASTPRCTAPAPDNFNDVMAQALTVIGGLISALVIAELAITRPGEAPGAHVFSATLSVPAERILKIVTAVYILVWLVAGLTAFMKGIYHPKVLPPFTSVGQSWLGLAVAAAYAYFGLKPSAPGSS
jgi:hypothetical protein